MTRSIRPVLIGIAGASVLATGGCASRGAPVPDIVTLHPYNGEWVLEAMERERVRVQFADRDGQGFTSVTLPSIGAVITIRAERFGLEVSDSIFRLSSDEPGFSAAVPVDGTPFELPGEDGKPDQSITLRWDEGTPVIRREVVGIGWVSERFELTGDGALVLKREAAVRNARGRVVDGVGGVEFVYTRDTGSKQ
jgi:hypothetical protein